MAENRTLNLALRALQVICALIVMGTDGYAINVYRGYSSEVDTHWGGFTAWNGVPNAWGFLLFCAAWTIIVFIFQLVAGNATAHRPFLVGCISVGAELVAVISWFAGWIAVAVNIGTRSCATGYVACDALKAATVFGAVEWLLFMVTAFLAVSLFLNSKRQKSTSTN
uniref:MARVEL domain containing protein n=1 Tax=Phoma sp. TaxID=1707701 RepID=A0A4D6ICJ8_PHOSX|nr:MARVEL domain containing protein [Phoma sp.]